MSGISGVSSAPASAYRASENMGMLNSHVVKSQDFKDSPSYSVRISEAAKQPEDRATGALDAMRHAAEESAKASRQLHAPPPTLAEQIVGLAAAMSIMG